MIVAASNPLTPLEHLLRHVLDWLHGTAGLPWAWAVVALTVIVRILLVPLMVRQIHSMQNLQRVAPQMKEIQRKYKDDKKRQQEEMMKFYRENNINPAASCLPLVAQLPVFFALYLVLRRFSKHPPCPGHPGKLATVCVDRGDFSWLGHHFIPNISAPTTAHWSGYVLLVVYVVSQMASSFFMGAGVDRTQRILFLVMPVAFVVFIARFPTGLVLYWMTTNLWVVGQGLITRQLIPKTAAPAAGPKRSSRTAPTPAPVPAAVEDSKPVKPAATTASTAG